MITSIGFSVLTGLRDTTRVFGRVLLLAAHTALLSVLVGASAGLVVQSTADVKAATRLSEFQAAFFAMGGVPQLSDTVAVERTRTELINRLSVPGAYSVLPPATKGGTLVVFGDFAKVFNLGGEHPTLPYALKGRNAPASNEVSLDGASVPIVETMVNAGWVNLWMEYSSLDASVVVVADPRVTIAQATEVQLSEIASRIVLLHPNSDDLIAYSTAVGDFVPIVPLWVNDKVGLNFTPDLQGRWAFLLVFSTGLLTTVVGMAAGVLALLESRYRDFVIHSCMGAGYGHIVARLGAFIASAWGLPAILFSWLGSRFVANGSYSGQIMTIVVLAVFVVVVGLH